MTDNDMGLVRQYAAQHSEGAFAALVSRHANLVYSVALRQVHNPQLAEEITQAVFIILAQKAGSLNEKTILPGWLYRTACFTSSSARKREQRRQQREQEAYMRSTLQEGQADAAWEQMSPLLEEAMLRLGQADRDALVLRFFEGRSLNEVGLALGASEHAAKKRVNRALEKLHGYFNQRGVHSTTAIIAGTISANSVHAAPAALAKSVTAVAITKGAAASGSTLTLIQGALKIMAWTKAKMAVVAGACVLLAAGTTTLVIANKPKAVQGIPQDWSVLQGDTTQWDWANNAINGHSTNGSTMLASNKKYGDVTLSALAGSTNRGAELAIRMQDAENGYLVVFTPDGTAWSAENGSCIKLVKKTSGDEVELGIFKRSGLALPGRSARMTVSAKGSRIEVFLNNDSILKVNDTAYPSGYVGLRVYGDTVKPSDATYSNLTVD
jgi:RNA polymerase sigma factor (sigma-70 family)